MTNKQVLNDFAAWMFRKHPNAVLTSDGLVEYSKMYLDAVKPPAIDHEWVINIFNAITGKKCKLTKSRKSLINGRAAEGNKKSQFRAVFEFKFNEWKNDPEMKKYITPETMLRAMHFQNYLEQARADYLRKHPVKHPKSEPIDDFNV